MGISRAYFSKAEVAYIEEVTEEKDRRFFEIWTKKEAYSKYVGKGLSMGLNSFDVMDEEITKLIQSVNKNSYVISFCNTNHE